MHFPIPTGQVAKLLGITEPQAAEAVRRGRVQPAPMIQAGRRLWSRDHVRQAAEALGLMTPDLEARLNADAEHELAGNA